MKRAWMLTFTAMLLTLLKSPAVQGQTWPDPAWPTTTITDALSGTTDNATAWYYIPRGTSPTSAVPLYTWLMRNQYRQAEALAAPNAGRVVKEDTLRIGVYPLRYVLSSTRKTFNGATDQGSGTLDAGDDTYYVYIDNANSLQIGTAWPADIAQFVALAEVAVASSTITGITDVRNWSRAMIPQAAGVTSQGTDAEFFVLNQDYSGGSPPDTEFRFNRGTVDDDAAVRWNETADRFELYLDTVNDEFSPLKLLTLESTQTTGTAPFTVASTTLVANLDADRVDGLTFTAPAAANGLAYSTSTSAVAFTAAAGASEVLYANAGVPTWAALGSASGIQAYDIQLADLASIGSSGFVSFDVGTTAANVRSITAGDGIGVTNGDGVSGNPTIAVSLTEHAVGVGGASGVGLTAIGPGSNNQVLCGATGADPTFRQIVNADIDAAAAIAYSKLAGVEASDQQLTDLAGIGSNGFVSFDVGTTAANVRSITAGDGITVTNGDGVAGAPTIAVATDVGQWIKYTKTYSDFSTAATTNTITLATLATRQYVHAVTIKHSTAFSGGAISAYTVSVGITGTATKYSAAFDVFQAVADGTSQVSTTQGLEYAAVNLTATATSTGANLDAATAGSVDVWVFVSRLP